MISAVLEPKRRFRSRSIQPKSIDNPKRRSYDWDSFQGAEATLLDCRAEKNLANQRYLECSYEGVSISP